MIRPALRTLTSSTRVRPVRQSTISDCGAACLAMVLTHHGRDRSLAWSRTALGCGRGGASALHLLDVARDEGLDATAFAVAPDGLRDLPLPAVAHWETNHFVVVERVRSSDVVIVDPASGRRTVSLDAFMEASGGVVLTFAAPAGGLEPVAEPAADEADDLGRWAQIRSVLSLRSVRSVLAQVAVASLFLQAFGVALPLFGKVVVDSVVPYRVETLLPVMALGMGLVVVAQAATAFLRSRTLVRLRARLDAHLGGTFFVHLLSLPYAYFQRRTSGDLLDRLNSNTALRDLISNRTTAALLDGLFVLSYFAVLAVLAPEFAWAAAGIAGLQVAFAVLTYRRVDQMMQEELRAKADSTGYAVEVLRGLKTIKSAGAEGLAVARWRSLFRGYLEASARRGGYAAGVDAVNSAIRTAAPLVVLWIGATLVLDGSISLGAMIAYNALALLLLTPIAGLITNAQSLYLAGAHLDRIADVLNAEPEPSGGGAPGDEAPVGGQIEFRNVSFRYGPNEPWVLRDVSFVVPAGDKAALVGRTGAGKSTLFALLLRLYEPTEGTILLDGQPLASFDPRALRATFGVVLQEPFLFSGTVRENLSFRQPGTDPEVLAECARRAAIGADIEALPAGDQTILGENGTGLSGGQRQRVALAQALVHDPPVLLLDEATSHLDAGTERVIDDRLDDVCATRLVIAHRPTTIRNADRILVLADGTVAESGTHDDLLAEGDVYPDLVGASA